MMFNIFPTTSLGDVFVFGGFYFEGDIGYRLPTTAFRAAWARHANVLIQPRL